MTDDQHERQSEKIVSGRVPGRSPYPPVPSDDELFDHDNEGQQLMADFGLNERQVRMVRAAGLI